MYIDDSRMSRFYSTALRALRTDVAGGGANDLIQRYFAVAG